MQKGYAEAESELLGLCNQCVRTTGLGASDEGGAKTARFASGLEMLQAGAGNAAKQAGRLLGTGVGPVGRRDCRAVLWGRGSFRVQAGKQ